VLIRLVFVVPCFHRDGAAGTDHVVPAAIVPGGEQGEAIRRITGLINRIHQELAPIYAARHTAGADECRYLLRTLLRHKTKRHRHHIGMQGSVVSAYSVPIGSLTLVP